MESIWQIFAYDDAAPLLFTQFYFWVFLAVVMLIFSLIHSKILLRNTFLFLVSVFFYYKTSGIFTLILLFSTLSSYVIGLAIGKTAKRRTKNIWLVFGVIVCLSVLCYFKYAYLITDMLNDLFGLNIIVIDYFAILGNALMGSETFRVDVIMLPVGISFYTFQCISYLMDIYRERIEPVRNVLDFGFYVSFFPQLVAGPIVRASDFVFQLHKPFFLSRRWFGIALFWILNGLAKKIILSDYIAVNFIDRVFSNPTMYSGYENLTALFGYSLQVYADFSGYTDIAIGVALLMGFYLPKNFNSPYKALNAPAFWKRWHISLSRWLQDYLYIPMGGNRNATFGTYAVIVTIAVIATFLSANIWVAIVILAITAICIITALLRPEKKKLITTNINAMNTMLLGGLWHGASWNFMIWGGLNGIGMIIYKLWHPLNIYFRVLTISSLTLFMWLLSDRQPNPLWNIGLFWIAAIAVGTTIQMLYHITRLPYQFAWVSRAWKITQTFVFITFTRLFFRAGSNLDPAEANAQAWSTATDMINRIGSKWQTDIIPQITFEFWDIFVLITIGMIIHWISEKTKRRYRLWFAMCPIWLQLIASVVIVIILYQFVTADLQKFIYFQF
ncbi:MAG: MBOAT family protein [Marinilabiliaceae bacterium]|nr:MBOAT family protein [Marinilabiliaceae bacterium]